MPYFPTIKIRRSGQYISTANELNFIGTGLTATTDPSNPDTALIDLVTASPTGLTSYTTSSVGVADSLSISDHKHGFSIGQLSASASTTISTSSASYVDVSDMSITLDGSDSCTWIIYALIQLTSGSTGFPTFQLIKNGSAIEDADTTDISGAALTSSIMDIFSVTSAINGDVIKLQWFIATGTAQATTRAMYAMRLRSE